MIITEEEATSLEGGKLCPYLYMGIGCNKEEGSAVCDGSGCMMWRWQDKKRMTGYCGLAGKP